MTEFAGRHKNFSTTKLLSKTQPNISNKPEDKFASVLFLPDTGGRKGEGGLRTQGYFKASRQDKPLITLITVVFNGEKFLEQTIQSVLQQTYDNVEYIIIDGGSTDGTLDIIQKYEHALDYWVSEPDGGISDAFNKGVICSTGDMIGIINADDWLAEKQIEIGVLAFAQSSVDFIFGNLLFHDEKGKVKHKILGDAGYAQSIASSMPNLCHPTVLVKRNAFKKVGLFDTRLAVAMDYEWLLRLHQSGGQGRYVKDITGHMRLAGVSDVSYIKALEEVRRISIQYGEPVIKSYFLYIVRVFKGVTRRRLEGWLPEKLYHRARGIVNRHYRS